MLKKFRIISILLLVTLLLFGCSSKQEEYLADGNKSEDKVLLPIKQVPAGAGIGDMLEVFLFRKNNFYSKVIIRKEI